MGRQKKQSVGSGPAKPMRHAASGPAPILEGEDSNAYDELLARISGAMKPKDAIEEFWVSDVVDSTWEIFRYRRYKTGLIKAAVHKALKEILEPIINGQVETKGTAFDKVQLKVSPTPVEQLMIRWTWRNKETLKHVDNLLTTVEMTMEDVNARAMALAIDDIERVDRLLLRAESSRNAVLREIERRRDLFAHRLRAAMHDLDEGEFKEVKSNVMTSESAAG